MAKKNKIDTKSIAGWIAMTIGFIVMLGVGGLFVNGTFTGVVILKLLPLIVHQVVGWLIIGGSILSAVLNFLK